MLAELSPASAQSVFISILSFPAEIEKLIAATSDSRASGENSTDDKDAAKKHLRPAVASVLQKIREKFVAVETWSGAALKDIVEQTAIESNMKMGKVAQPLRVAVTGSSASPSIDITLELLGRKRCLERLDGALVYIAERAAT